MKSLLVVIGVEIVDGRPALDLPEGVEIEKTGPGIFSVSWKEHTLTGKHLGRIDGTRYFLCSGDKRIVTGLAHLGASVRLVRDLTPAQKNRIRSAGVKVYRRISDGVVLALHPEVVHAGTNPKAIAFDGNIPEEEIELIA